MNKIGPYLLGAILLSASYGVHADDKRKHSIGFGTYAVIVAQDTFFSDDEFSGFILSGTSALTHNIAIRGGLYSTEHYLVSSVEASGLDLQVLLGNNFDEQGFKIYGGAGVYNEKWEGVIGDPEFSGLQLTFGIGYNWDRVALDWWGTSRGASDYTDYYGVDTVAASGSLSVSYRF